MPSQTKSYFPAFLTLQDRKILLVGGGKIASDKLSKLLDFTLDIKIIAKNLSQEIKKYIKKYNLEYELREYREGDIDSFDIVIVAVDDIILQKNIYFESRDKKIFVNSVDSREFCDFIFGSYIKKDDLIISISTSGSSPSVSKYLKIFLEKALPKNLSSFLKEIKSLRESLPKGKDRMTLLDRKTKEFFDSLQ